MGRAVSVTRLERKLRAVLGALGSSLVTSVEDYSGLLQLEVDRPEWAFAGGELLYFAGNTRAALAGEVSKVGLRNPANSGVLCVLEQFTTKVATGTQHIWLNVDEDTTATIRGFNRDLRISRGDPLAAVASACNTFAATELAGASGQGPVLEVMSAALWIPMVIIVPPGQNVAIKSNSVNVSLDVSFVWREIPLEASVSG